MSLLSFLVTVSSLVLDGSGSVFICSLRTVLHCRCIYGLKDSSLTFYRSYTLHQHTTEDASLCDSVAVRAERYSHDTLHHIAPNILVHRPNLCAYRPQGGPVPSNHPGSGLPLLLLFRNLGTGLPGKSGSAPALYVTAQLPSPDMSASRILLW